MSEVITILAESREAAYAILNANYESYNVRIASDHDYFSYNSAPPIVSTVDQHMPDGRLDSFIATHPDDNTATFILVAIIPD